MGNWIKKQWDIFVEEKRRRRQKRQERRNKHREKKRKQYIISFNRKPSFFKMFFKRTAIFLVVAIIFSTVFTFDKRDEYIKQSDSELSNIYSRLEDELNSIYEKCYFSDKDNSQIYGNSPYENGEWNQMFLNYYKFAMVNWSESTENLDSCFAIYDRDTGQCIADSTAEVYALVRKNDDVPAIYTADENSRKIYSDMITSIPMEDGAYMDNPGEVRDIYVKDGEFSIGNIDWIECVYDDLKSINVLNTIDYTPDNVTDYEHLISEDTLYYAETENGSSVNTDGAYATIWIIYGRGYDTDDNMYKLFEKYMSDDENHIYDDGTSGFSFASDNLTYTELCYDDSIVIDGRTLDIVSVARCDMVDRYGKQFLIFYIVMFLVAILIALMFSISAFTRDKIRYETDMYRRNTSNAMAHDLKSPLMAISGYAENLVNGIKPEKTGEYAAGILEITDYMNNSIANILELSESEELYGRLHLEKVDIKLLTEKIIKNYELRLVENDVTINVNGEAVIKCDKSWMLRVIDNLIGNAVKYAEPVTGIDIVMNDKFFEISNTYTGIIENQDKLTEAFVKGDSARSGNNGTGLGLAIVKNILDVHGYSLEIRVKDRLFIAKIIF
jgi:signal transduction histidine kinase